MRRRFSWSVLAMAVGCAAILAATEKPSRDFQDLMKSNGSIVDISLGSERASTGTVGSAPPSLKTHIRAKDYDGIAQDAATLKANFTKVTTFWTERNIDDAATISRAAVKAADELETAARAKDDTRIATAANAVAATCRECHQSHRVMQLTNRTSEIM